MELISEAEFFDLAMEMGFPRTKVWISVDFGGSKLWSDMVSWNRQKAWLDELDRNRTQRLFYGEPEVKLVTLTGRKITDAHR